METILVTGASGYIGGRLVPRLVEKGFRVRCLARDPRKLSGYGWDDRVEVTAGDVLDRDSLDAALAGCTAAYYLVHSMNAGEGSFEDRDRTAAGNFSSAAAGAGAGRIIYLGGLGSRSNRHSPHLSSRHEVGDILRTGTVPVTELRAAMIIGAGSASFEMMRALVSRLPVMVCPRWVENRTQPIAIRDVLNYLVECLATPATAGQRLDIGGPDILTYRQMMERFAAILGLKRKDVRRARPDPSPVGLLGEPGHPRPRVGRVPFDRGIAVGNHLRRRPHHLPNTDQPARLRRGRAPRPRQDRTPRGRDPLDGRGFGPPASRA